MGTRVRNGVLNLRRDGQDYQSSRVVIFTGTQIHVGVN
jgi:hypothetical protein